MIITNVLKTFSQNNSLKMVCILIVCHEIKKPSSRSVNVQH